MCQSSTQHTPTGLPQVFIVGAARTPVGSFQGVLSKVSAVNLGVAAVEGVLAQAGVKAEQVEDLYFGNVLQGGVGQSPARQVVIGAGLPESTEATTVNKVSRAHGGRQAARRGKVRGWGPKLIRTDYDYFRLLRFARLE